MADREELWTYEETMEFFRYGSTMSVRRLVNSGEIERVFIGHNSPRILASSVFAFIERQRQAA